MKVIEIVERGRACCARLPERTASVKTLKAYWATFARMWREPELDALRPDIALDTYHHRRAALHAISRLVIMRLIANCLAAEECNDIAGVQRWERLLVRALDRIEPALALDPPLVAGVTPLQSPASRWRAQAGPRKARGANSKKNVLALLPSDWDQRLWQAALDVWNKPEDERDRDALAAALLAPVRPEEFVPGERPDGCSEGVVVVLHSPHRLDITISPAKSHNGRYGTGATTVKIDPITAGGPATYLAARCDDDGGRMVITIRSKDAQRKKLARLGEIALPEHGVTITTYVCRHQVIADLKATFGGGGDVAAAASHCTDRTQAKYGRVEHGRKRRGYIGVECKRAPRVGNVARTRELAARRQSPAPGEAP
jgi:hypothetical protein